MRKSYEPKNWETIPCPFCKSSAYSTFQKFGDRYQYTYVRCKDCSLVYHNPRPKYDQDFLDAAYGEYFVYDPDYKYSATELWEFGQEVNEIIQFDSTRSSMLEIGSCMGAFLTQAQPHYSNVEGLEISDTMADFTESRLGVKVHRVQFEDFRPGKKYSCIHMSHVIEHIPNPGEWMDKAYELLEEDGILVICVPNILSLGRMFKLVFERLRIRDGRWKESWRTPDHLFEPSVKSMKYLIQKHRFKILSHYSYSRKNPVSKGGFALIPQRKLRFGSNLRFYLQKIL